MRHVARTLFRLALGGVGVLGLGLGAAFLAARQAARSWPSLEDTTPVAVPESVLPEDPEAATALAGAITAGATLKAHRTQLRALLGAEGPPALVDLPTVPEADAALEVLASVSGLRVAPVPLDGTPPDLAALVYLAEYGLAKGWQAAGEGDAAGALRRFGQVSRAGLLLQHSGGNLVAVMAGVAVESWFLQELGELARARPDLPAAETGGLARSLAAAGSLPPAVASGLAGECLGQETLLANMPETVREDLAGAGPVPPFPGVLRLLYDPRRTVAASRTRCQALVAAARQPPLQRTWPAPEPLWRTGFHPVQYVDNPVGRILLDIATPALSEMVTREDDLRSARALAAAGLAAHAWRQRTGTLPVTLDELVPDLLPAVPEDPLTGAAVRYDGHRVWCSAEADPERAWQREFRP